MTNQSIIVRQVAYHRNGISGEPFHAVLFSTVVDDISSATKPSHAPRTENFLASVFEEAGAVSVISLDRIEEDGVNFGENSWRGDHYEAALRATIADYQAAQIDGRALGPDRTKGGKRPT